VPHAPLLVEELSPRGFERPTAAVRAAVAALRWDDAEVVVLLAPHGRRSGVYRRVQGSLAAFGVAGVAGEWETAADVASDLAGRWGVPLLDDGVDHGVLVPLLLGAAGGRPVVAATAAETAGPRGDVHAALDLGRSLAALLRPLGPAVGFIASANTSAALSARAPYGRQGPALEVEEEVLDALVTDVGRLDPLALRLVQQGRSCAAAPLACLARLRRGSRAEVCAYERPAGVGYPVARVP
jgi:hypothetical protein